MNLRLFQLGDSALPIGGYSHSWGLEAAIDQGLVRDASGLEKWVRLWLHEAAGPLEGVIVAGVCRAVQVKNWLAVRHANELLQAGLTPSTLRSASREMGQQLLALAENWPWASENIESLPKAEGNPTDGRAWHHAIVFATLAAGVGSTPEETVAVFLHQAALGMISAGVRGVPIGHTHGQQIVARLHDDVMNLAADLPNRYLETAGSFCPAYEILCHAQTQLYTRLFRS